MKNKIELILSYLVIASALQYGVMVSLALNFHFAPEQMAAPGMVIAFITACCLNIVKLKDDSASRKIYSMAAFANALTLSYAVSLSVQDPHIGKIVTTLMMGAIFFLSLVSCFTYQVKIGNTALRQSA